MGVYAYCFFFFFFQAEDGIRDVAVTGVQTCALPIYIAVKLPAVLGDVAAVALLLFAYRARPRRGLTLAALYRSEEHTSELQSRLHLVCRLLLEKKKKTK